MSYANAFRDKCPCCTGNALHPFSSENGHALLICEVCRHVFFQEIPSITELEEYYKGIYSDSHEQLSKQKGNEEYYECHLKELRAYSASPVSFDILDYGCSYPIFLEVAKRNGANVLGCDYSETAVEYGKKVGVPIISPDGLSCVNQHFDVIRFSHAIEHPLETLRHASALLKENGIIYITQPSFPVFKVTGFSGRVKDAVYPNHIHFFSPLSLVELANNANLDVIVLFTHQKEHESFDEYGKYVDFITGATRLINVANCGDHYFGFLNNYPFFMGENVVAIMKSRRKPHNFMKRAYSSLSHRLLHK